MKNESSQYLATERVNIGNYINWEKRMKDKDFLNWIYERMINVHGEKDMYDYMINFKSIIDRQEELNKVQEENKQLWIALEALSPTVKK